MNLVKPALVVSVLVSILGTVAAQDQMSAVPVILSSSLSAAGQVSNSRPSFASKTQLVILGTGTPQADPDNSGPAVAVIAGGAAYFVDCGPG